MLTTQNTVYNQSYIGIDVPSSVYDVSDNIVHDNATGISSFSNSSALLQGNTVYHNTGDGIEAEGNTVTTGNIVYGNATGIAADYGNFSNLTVTNNLVYENTTQGILITGDVSGTYANNTVYQPTGDAIDVVNGDKNVVLKNNILWTLAGYDIKVDPTSEVGFQSDYNDLYTTAAGSIGSWEGQSFGTLASWILELNLDHHSQSVDPQVVAPAGADGILGYGTTAIGAPWSSTTRAASGFATVGTWTPVTNSSASTADNHAVSDDAGRHRQLDGDLDLHGTHRRRYLPGERVRGWPQARWPTTRFHSARRHSGNLRLVPGGKQRAGRRRHAQAIRPSAISCAPPAR